MIEKDKKAIVEESYIFEIKDAIRRSLVTGEKNFEEVLIALGAPDPRLLQQLYDEVQTEPDLKPSVEDQVQLYNEATRARRLTSTLPLKLPASNPIHCQWWFSLDTIEMLAKLAWELRRAEPVAFLGAPTVGYFYANWIKESLSILDGDQDVLNALDVPQSSNKILYDVNLTLPSELKGRHSVVLMDPPWYSSVYELFIARGRELLANPGFLLCAMPSRLTRPGIIEERTALLNKLLNFRFEIVSFESGKLKYLVPEFEAKAYEDIRDFSGRQWRRGDLLVLRVIQDTKFVVPECNYLPTKIYSRNPIKRRYFLSPDKIDPQMKDFVQMLPEFQREVSSRGTPLETITVWGTNKRAARLKASNIFEHILALWASGKNREETIQYLSDLRISNEPRLVDDLDAALLLWSNPDKPICRRSTTRLLEFRKNLLSEISANPSPRTYFHQDDGFRLEFQRDRDRILWSQSLKRLANKTQLFPVQSDDQLRRRLSHSIEVMQLAATIANAFGLDRDLTEAGALVHDIGHSPFGHAGEYALNALLNDIDIRIGGFNHYENGLDVVRWLESPYRSPGAGEFPGLNLTIETMECILKHTYHRENHPMGQKTLVEKSKHKDITDDSLHLEGQAVRVADKISYLISDIEDGIRVGAFGLSELMTCRFFSRPPIDLKLAHDENLLDRFISQRRSILKVIMEDILTATDERLSGIKNIQEVRKQREYIVDFSIEIKKEMEEIWRNLQVGILHKHRDVISENYRAARIVSDLLITFSFAPELIDLPFQRMHRGLNKTEYLEWYRRNVGDHVELPTELISRFSYEKALTVSKLTKWNHSSISIEDFIMAKDYVASLTDARAFKEYKSFFGGIE